MITDKHNKKTLSKHWNNFSLKPKRKKIQLIKFFNINRFFLIFFGFKLSLKVVKKNRFEDDAFQSYQKNGTVIDYRNSVLSKLIFNFLKKYNIYSNYDEINNYITEFNRIFLNSPIRDLNSGFGFNESLIFYCLLKKINPSIVIESGIMRGFTTYIIDKATSPHCKILCYDINLNNLEFKSKKAKYHNYDISIKPPQLNSERIFAFWDDHTSHLERLNFSIKNKINFNIFDDDLSFLNFHSDGWPPLPSITMLYEIKRKLIKDKEIQWISKNRLGKLWLDDFLKDKSINMIKYHHYFPDLFSLTGYRRHSNSSFVVLN